MRWLEEAMQTEGKFYQSPEQAAEQFYLDTSFRAAAGRGGAARFAGSRRVVAPMTAGDLRADPPQ